MTGTFGSDSSHAPFNVTIKVTGDGASDTYRIDVSSYMKELGLDPNEATATFVASGAVDWNNTALTLLSANKVGDGLYDLRFSGVPAAGSSWSGANPPYVVQALQSPIALTIYIGCLKQSY